MEVTTEMPPTNIKKKLLLITQSGRGGLRKHLCDLLNNLDYEKFKVWIIYNDLEVDDIFKATLQNHPEVTGYVVRNFVRELTPKDDWLAFRKVNKIIKQVKPDIVHCHSSKAGVVGRLAAKWNKIPKIFYTSHWYSFLSPEFSQKKRYLFINIERFLSKHATTKTFNTSFGEKKAAVDAKIDKDDKFEVIYNGLSEVELPSKREARSCLDLPQDSFIFGNTARLNHQKNPKLFLEIASKVIQEDNKIHFVWIGDGPLYQEMSNLVKTKNIEKNFHLLGAKENADVLVSAFDAFLSTSNGESFGYSAVEALRAGVPVFLSNVMGHEEIVIPDVNGQLFDQSEILFQTGQVFQFIKWLDSADNRVIKQSFERRFRLASMVEKIEQEYLSVNSDIKKDKH